MEKCSKFTIYSSPREKIPRQSYHQNSAISLPFSPIVNHFRTLKIHLSSNSSGVVVWDIEKEAEIARYLDNNEFDSQFPTRTIGVDKK